MYKQYTTEPQQKIRYGFFGKTTKLQAVQGAVRACTNSTQPKRNEEMCNSFFGKTTKLQAVQGAVRACTSSTQPNRNEEMRRKCVVLLLERGVILLPSYHLNTPLHVVDKLRDKALPFRFFYGYGKENFFPIIGRKGGAGMR